ncbi:MAG: sensor histidine kinase [Candidatus Oleimicrobiaceae bacterium]
MGRGLSAVKLQAKIVLLLAVLIFFFTTVEYGILLLRIESYHRAVERDYAEVNFLHTLALLRQEQQELAEVVRVLADHEAPLGHAVSAQSLRRQLAARAIGKSLWQPPCDFLALYEGGLLAWCSMVDSAGAAPCAGGIEAALAPLGALFVQDSSGLLNSPCGPLVLAGAPLPGGGRAVVAGRRLDRRTPRLSALLQRELTFFVPDSLTRLHGLQIERSNPRMVTARGVLADVTGAPEVGLLVSSPKMFLARQERTLLLALLANTAVGLAVAFIVMALLQKLVIKRINSLVEQVSAIRATGDFGLRVQVSGSDEVGTLAAAFNEALSRLHQMARRIEESEQRYASLVEQSRDGVAILVDGKVRFANCRLLTMAGCENLEQLASSGLTFLPEEARAWLDAAAAGSTEHAAGSMPTRLMGAGGQEMEVEVDSVPGTYEGQPAVFLYLRDVSEKKRMERHLQRVDKLTSLGQLSSGIAHEIRTPLGSIQLNLDHLLQCTTLTDEQRRVVESSMEAVNRISSIVQRTLDFARPAEPSFEPTALTQVVDNVLKMMATSLRRANVTVLQQWEKDLPLVQADRSQLNQAFVNIVLNAAQAMPRGGRLRIWGRRRNLGNNVVVEVGFEDSGVGIAPENLRRVFDPFFTTKYEGVGLGLSVVHRIVESHRATIDIASTPGKGTTVYIHFPVAQP